MITSLLLLLLAVTFAILSSLILSIISAKLYVLNPETLVVLTIVLVVNVVPLLLCSQSRIASGKLLSSKSAWALLIFAGVTVSVPAITFNAL